MKPSITVLLLLATVSCLTGGTKQAVKTGNGDVAFTLEWWDDGYTVPYQVYSKNRDVTAHHKFDSDGRLFQITVGSTTCTFYWDSIDGGEEAPRVELADSGDETLLGQDEEIFVNDVGLDIVSDPRDLHACYGCESTHEAMCHQGLEDTCYWAANVPESFSDDCELAITTLCSAFTEACMESSEAACTAQCAGGECERCSCLQITLGSVEGCPLSDCTQPCRPTDLFLVPHDTVHRVIMRSIAILSKLVGMRHTTRYSFSPCTR